MGLGIQAQFVLLALENRLDEGPWKTLLIIIICRALEYCLDEGPWTSLLIIIFRALEYCLDVEKLNLSAIRTVRVLRPLRAINRIPSRKRVGSTV